jgi:DNA-binding transcriptional regulator LsrR (DeoR family)
MDSQFTADRLRQAWAAVRGYEEGAKTARSTFLSLVDRYLKVGWKQADIARELGITRQQLGMMLKRGSS